jgi:acyl-homoserine-lactone acylase
VDGLPGSGFGRQWLQDVLFSNRHYSADIMRADVVTLCSQNPIVDLGGGLTVDVTQACGVLAAWDGRNKVASVGAHVWTEFWRRAASAPNLYAVPFDPADPVNTPRGINLGSASVRNGERIPIHGGNGVSGVWNAIQPAGFTPGVGYAPIVAGSSYIQAVGFTPSGPDARAIVTYSVSTDPENPHYADMTKLYSKSGWVKMPFAEGDIRRDPNLKVMNLSEKR